MWKAACDLLYSELNGSEYDNNSRIQSCPVAEHSLWERIAEISKNKKKYVILILLCHSRCRYPLPDHQVDSVVVTTSGHLFDRQRYREVGVATSRDTN